MMDFSAKQADAHFALLIPPRYIHFSFSDNSFYLFPSRPIPSFFLFTSLGLFSFPLPLPKPRYRLSISKFKKITDNNLFRSKR